jgi:excisionase family DNA binding protein
MLVSLSRFTKSGCALHPYIFWLRLACSLLPQKPNRLQFRVSQKVPQTWGTLVLKNSLAEAPCPRLLNVREAAAYLACSVHAVRQLQWNRAIPSIKIGKLIQFDRADLDAYVDRLKA